MSSSASATLLPLYDGPKSSPAGGPDRRPAPPTIRVLCLDLTHYNGTTQFLCCCAGVFVFYLMYGYMQELIFTLDGFKPYGWYLTLVQFAYYVAFSFVEQRVMFNLGGDEPLSLRRPRIPFRTYFLLAFLTIGTMGLSNSSLRYLNYPTQVIFKCCKLVPVMIGSVLIQKKTHGPIEFLAALAMCVGLTLFTLVDAKVSPNFNSHGIVMISTALLFDAAIGNVQEKAMREHKATNTEVVFFSYAIGFGYLLVAMIVSGTLYPGLSFCATYPIQTYGYAFLFSLSGYLGIQFVLTLVRTTGAPMAATVTTARKAITIAISFLLFSKPFSWDYIWSGLIVVLGIYLNVYSKRNKMTFRECCSKLRMTKRAHWTSASKRSDDGKRLLTV